MAALNQTKQREAYGCMEPQSSVICHQPLPLNSKLTTASVPPEEAGQNGWNCHKNPDGTVLVGMRLQCQIDRSKKVVVYESSSRL